ncbi:MAG: DUF3145 family protein [Rhodoluna sp.]
MSSQQVVLTLFLHACPSSKAEQISALLGVAPTWHQQPLILGSNRAEVKLSTSIQNAEELISGLGRMGEIYADAILHSRNGHRLYMLVPGLGIFQAETNALGEILLNEERVRIALEQSAGNFRELSRLLRLALGQAWDDVLEPIRATRYSDNLSLINRAV